jgi:ankyrin repeat protein
MYLIRRILRKISTTIVKKIGVVNMPYINQKTIQEAARDGDLIKLGALINKQQFPQKDIDKALCRSIANGNILVTKYLIEQGADIDFYKNFVLAWCIANDHLIMTKYLIEEHGAKSYVDKNPLLVWCIVNGQLQMAKYLIEQGADINIYKNALLHCCTKNARSDIAEYLVKDHNAVDDDSRYAGMVYLVIHGYLTEIKYLVEEYNPSHHRFNDIMLSKCVNYDKNYHMLWIVKGLIDDKYSAT